MFRMASAMAAHAGRRQAVIATNMANSDTPGYRARDVVPFAEVYRPEGSHLRATRTGHLFGAGDARKADIHFADVSESSPNGNSVALEDQLMRGVDAKRQHDRALAIYRSGLTVLRASLGRR
jgi:flagellar basal-body rod protein FlgB